MDVEEKRTSTLQLNHLLLIPNILTLTRIFSILPTIYFLEGRYPFGVVAMMGFLFLTDFLDGMIARRYNQISLLGSILDPVADKLVVLSLFGFYFLQDQVPWLYFGLVFIRDIAQLSAIPILLWIRKISFQVKPRMIPKWGTALNFFLLAGIILKDIFPVYETLVFWIDQISEYLFWVSGVIEVYILSTFLPRFYQIYHRKHDTFE